MIAEGKIPSVAKRYTDSDKWKKQWYRELGSRLRDLRQYVLDTCDHAGIWEIDLSSAKHFTGHDVEIKDIEDSFRGEVVRVGESMLFIPTFIAFQYGELRPENRVHQTVLRRIETLKIKGRGWVTHEAKDKEKEQEKEKDREEHELFDFNALYQTYPRKEGKAAGMKRLKSIIKTKDDFDLFARAVRNYASKCTGDRTEPSFIKHWSSFIGTRDVQPWRDYVDFKPSSIASLGIVER